MQSYRTWVVAAVAVAVLSTFQIADGQGPPFGRGPGGAGEGRGPGGRWNDPAFRADMEDIHTLLRGRADIRRNVEHLENGVKTTTESDNPQLAKLVQRHVRAMKSRLETADPIHLRDPLFAALFRHADAIEMELEPTEKGIIVIETSANPRVVKLIQAHAEVVSLFVANGHAEVRRNHDVPQ